MQVNRIDLKTKSGVLAGCVYHADKVIQENVLDLLPLIKEE